MEYIYTSPAENGLYYKSTYCRLVRGSDGREYVVCSGKYEEGP